AERRDLDPVRAERRHAAVVAATPGPWRARRPATVGPGHRPPGRHAGPSPADGSLWPSEGESRPALALVPALALRVRERPCTPQRLRVVGRRRLVHEIGVDLLPA